MLRPAPPGGTLSSLSQIRSTRNRRSGKNDQDFFWMGPYSAMCRSISMTNSALKSPNSLLHEKQLLKQNFIFKKIFFRKNIFRRKKKSEKKKGKSEKSEKKTRKLQKYERFATRSVLSDNNYLSAPLLYGTFMASKSVTHRSVLRDYIFVFWIFLSLRAALRFGINLGLVWEW